MEAVRAPVPERRRRRRSPSDEGRGSARRYGRWPTAAIGALLVAWQAVGPVRAQSVDECMRAEPEAAVALCGALIDAGRADAAVHAQLVLNLDKRGRSAEARRALDRGLGAWPDDRDLIDLRERLGASISERDQLEQAARRNESAMSQGQLRLLCLTKTSEEGLAACREHLTLTDKDGDRVRARLAEIEDALPPTVAELPLPDPTPDAGSTKAPDTDEPLAVDTPDEPRSPEPDGAVVPPPPPVAEAPSVPTPEDTARRALIANVQRALNVLDFDAGSPDGVAGRRTLDALARFGERTNAGGTLPLDDDTLERLEDASRDRDTARDLLAESRAAASGAPEAALRTLTRAEETSALLVVPFGYRAELEAARDEARREADASAEAEAEVEPETDAPPAADTASELMTLIGTLERRLADEATVRRGADTRLRDVVERTLAADAPD